MSSEVVVNMKICEGVKWDGNSAGVLDGTAYVGNLVKDSQSSKWKAADGGLKGITDVEKKNTVKGAIAACRYWYDEQKYGKPFCCQYGESGFLDADKKYTRAGVEAQAVIDGTKTSGAKAVEFEVNGFKMRAHPGAEGFNAAIQMTITAATAFAAAAIAMQ